MEAGEWNDYCNPGSTSFLTIPDPDDEKHRYAILGEIPPLGFFHSAFSFY